MDKIVTNPLSITTSFDIFPGEEGLLPSSPDTFLEKGATTCKNKKITFPKLDETTAIQVGYLAPAPPEKEQSVRTYSPISS